MGKGKKENDLFFNQLSSRVNDKNTYLIDIPSEEVRINQIVYK